MKHSRSTVRGLSEGCRHGGDRRLRTDASVSVRIETLTLPTWLPHPPDPNPMFLEKRVYQGSGGEVYPLPFTDRIAEKPVNREWKAVWIENQFLRVLVLPETKGKSLEQIERELVD